MTISGSEDHSKKSSYLFSRKIRKIDILPQKRNYTFFLSEKLLFLKNKGTPWIFWALRVAPTWAVPGVLILLCIEFRIS